MRTPEKVSGGKRLEPPGSSPDGDEDSDGDSPVSRCGETARWGETALPGWLDTDTGRRAWDRRATQFECLDDAPPADTEAAEGVDADPDPYSGSDTDTDIDDWSEPRTRWTMLPPAAIGLILIGIIGCGFAGYSLLRHNEPTAPLVAFEETVPSRESGDAAPESASGAAASGASRKGRSAPMEVVVSVVGLVRRPGLVRLPADSRVADALDAAGGARDGADTVSLNLAQSLRDGDQVLVGRRGRDQVRSAVVASGGGGAPGASKDRASNHGASNHGGSSETGGTSGAGGSGAALVNLNTATEAELDALPGVGPVTATSILAWRKSNGRFSSVDQLADVDGIGPSKLAKLRDLVTVG